MALTGAWSHPSATSVANDTELGKQKVPSGTQAVRGDRATSSASLLSRQATASQPLCRWLALVARLR